MGSTITAAHIEAKGCALCEAGAGLWLGTVIGQNLDALPGLFDSLTDWLKTDTEAGPDAFFGDLSAFLPVRAIKNRHKCVTLAFATAEKFTSQT